MGAMEWLFNKAFNHATELSRISAKAVILREHEVLLLRKSSGKWDLPGGKIDAGETIFQGLLREVREESGLDVCVDEFLVAIDRTKAHLEEPKGPLYAFLCSASAQWCETRLRLSAEHVEAQLANLWQADSLPMGRSCQRALAAAQDFLETR